MSGGKGSAIPSLSRDKEAGKVKVITNLTKIIAGLNKVREKVKTLREAISSLSRNFQTSSEIMVNFLRLINTLAKEKKGRKKREERREGKREKERRRERREKQGRF